MPDAATLALKSAGLDANIPSKFYINHQKARLITVPQQTLLLAAPVAFGLGRTFVVELFTLGDSDL